MTMVLATKNAVTAVYLAAQSTHIALLSVQTFHTSMAGLIGFHGPETSKDAFSAVSPALPLITPTRVHQVDSLAFIDTVIPCSLQHGML